MNKILITELQCNSTSGYLGSYSSISLSKFDILPFKSKLIKNHRKEWVMRYSYLYNLNYLYDLSYLIPPNSYTRTIRIWREEK